MIEDKEYRWKKSAQGRFSSGEFDGVIGLSKRKFFSGETTFIPSVLSKFHILIELGRKTIYSDQIRNLTIWAKSSSMEFCNDDYSSKNNYFLKKKSAKM